MHTYAIDHKQRRTVTLIIAGLSVLLAWVLGAALEYAEWTVPWWLDSPSVFGFFGLLFKWYDERGWRWEPIHRGFLKRIPDLNGTWKLSLRSSYDDFGTTHTGKVVIKQTWSRIALTLSTDTSTSESRIATLQYLAGTGQYELVYQYENRPKADASPALIPHRGTAWLSLASDGASLDGEYFSGRGRQTFGRMMLERGT